LRPLADQGDAQAQYNLGVFYENGQGVPPNDAEAVKWYHKAAEQGYGDARYNLGAMFLKGLGVPQNYVQAHMWFNLAAMAGDQGAAQNRGLVAAHMTPAQIAGCKAARRNGEKWLN
jgi:TPR repeat protein